MYAIIVHTYKNIDLMHSIYGITNKDSQKKCLFRLSTVLCDPEIAEAFDELEGLPHLITALQSTSGNR